MCKAGLKCVLSLWNSFYGLSVVFKLASKDALVGVKRFFGIVKGCYCLRSAKFRSFPAVIDCFAFVRVFNPFLDPHFFCVPDS